MKNRDITLLYNSINTLIGDESSKNLNINTKFKIAKNQRKISNIYEIIEEQRSGIIKKYGIPQEDGSYKIMNDQLPAATKELSELLDIETQCNLDKIELNELENANLKIALIMGLMCMIKDPGQ